MAFKLIPAEFLVSGQLLGKYTLVGDHVQSSNYVPGVSGWAIFGNGNAEFNNGTFRGLVEAAAILLQGSSGQILVYSGAPAAGNLIGSISGVAATDSQGNPYDAGVAAYVTDPNTGDRWAIDLASGVVGLPGLVLHDLTRAFNTPPSVVAQGTGAAGGGLRLSSGQAAAGTNRAALFSLTDQSASTIQGGLVQGQAGQAQFNLGAGAAATASLSAVLPDTNTYRAERLILDATATPQTITLTTATVITGCTALVIAGIKYAFRARVTFKGGTAAGTANFSVTGPALSAGWINAIMGIGGVVNVGAQDATLGPVNSPVLATSDGVADIEGEATFSAGGTIGLACAEGTSGDTVIIEHARFWLFPV